jgi:hypothetical protein
LHLGFAGNHAWGFSKSQTGKLDYRVDVWSTTTGQYLGQSTINLPGYSLGTTLSADATVFLTSTGARIKQWNPLTGQSTGPTLLEIKWARYGFGSVPRANRFMSRGNIRAR